MSNKLQYFNETALDSGILPVVGGNTNVTLTSAATLASLNVSATPLGTATIDTSGTAPLAPRHLPHPRRHRGPRPLDCPAAPGQRAGACRQRRHRGPAGLPHRYPERRR